jgi:uncharacterized PurR-regulated membrane protein YhhQ (DUF165 family)
MSMRDDSHEDPWLLPTHQADDAYRDALPESRLHGRREGTFLFLSSLFLLAVILPIALGTNQVIDLGYTLSRMLPDREPLVALGLPVATLLVPLGLVAVQLVCELYGRRRASAMVWTGLAAALVTVGVMRLSNELSGGAEPFGPAVGFAAFFVVAHVVNISVFDAMRRSMHGRALALRTLAASVVAPLLACAALAGALLAFGWSVDDITPIAAGTAMFSIACALAGVLPVVLAVRGLEVYLRVGGAPIDVRVRPRRRAADSDVSLRVERRLAQGSVSEARPRPAAPPPVPGRRIPNASQVQPFNSAEMRFFTEGDELAGADG